MSHDYEATWRRYASAWKAETAEEKRAILDGSVIPECVYTDPLVQLTGWDALVQYMLEFHEQIPGGHFVTTWFLAHHGRSVARWNMVDGAGTVHGDGVSYVEYDDDGRLVSMTGFFDTSPS